jgi:hypothetical protein
MTTETKLQKRILALLEALKDIRNGAKPHLSTLNTIIDKCNAAIKSDEIQQHKDKE